MARFFLRPKREALPDHLMLEVGGESVKIRLTRNSRARRYLLRVPADRCEPVLTVPDRGSLATALDFAERHRRWLGEKLAERPTATAFTDGAVIPFRGAPHLISSTGRLRGVVSAHVGEEIAVLHVPGEAAHLARKLTDWLKREARRDLDAAVAHHAAKLERKPSRISIRDTRSRWGSCTAAGHLSFSWRLVLAPPEILDYVAAHEVAHLIEMNHGQRFWRLCRHLAPHTEEARLWLKQNGGHLHTFG